MYLAAYLLPATFIRSVDTWHITGWGWEAALLSVLPPIMLATDRTLEVLLLTLTITPSNVAFIAAAILLPLGKRRAALGCAVLALASMIYGGFAVPGQQSDPIHLPAGHLGPGYYVWVLAGAFMVWASIPAKVRA